MAVNMILLPSIFSFFFFLFFFFLSLTSQDEQRNNHNLLILELPDAKLKISLLESVLEERIQNLNTKTLSLKEHAKSLEDMANKSTYLQSALSDLKDHSFLADEKLNALEEEVHSLWAVSRKNNFDLHVLELKAQDANDRLEAVSSQVGKMAEVVTEQWVQIQHLEQALQIAKGNLKENEDKDEGIAISKAKEYEMHILEDGISGRLLLKPFNALDSYSLGKGPIIRYYVSQALQQLKRFCSAIRRFHPELQAFIKEEMQRNELTAAFVNDELVFLLAYAFITFPILGAWMLLLT
ncbi:alpha-glucan phosphorylase 1 isoform X1 [Gossypium australe]|uniref:Alpha-glucan phosphorylase 1 isoform X1 n=1 Tax=Gossypium australe TaxID=47621 RepID=A0A5B6X8J9_9ROSI|nr:alpha-glucan phosphorylase 1 isoform X1 [Gossypium australe]